MLILKDINNPFIPRTDRAPKDHNIAETDANNWILAWGQNEDKACIFMPLLSEMNIAFAAKEIEHTALPTLPVLRIWWRYASVTYKAR